MDLSYSSRAFQVASGAPASEQERRDVALAIIRDYLYGNAQERPDAQYIDFVFRLAEPLVAAANGPTA